MAENCYLVSFKKHECTGKMYSMATTVFFYFRMEFAFFSESDVFHFYILPYPLTVKKYLYVELV